MSCKPYHKTGGPGYMGNVNGEADRGQTDPVYEAMCDAWMLDMQVEAEGQGLCSWCYNHPVLPGGDLCAACQRFWDDRNGEVTL